MVTHAQAIQVVLNDNAPADLASRYSAGMEAQVNVAQDQGRPAFDDDGKPRPNTYTDGCETWYNFRLPKNAKGEPTDNSQWSQNFNLASHYEAVGVTGWNFKQKRSIGVGFDFDSLENHAEGVGVDADRLSKVVEFAKRLGYVEVRKSTSGTGYHLWVWFDPNNLPETANHNEHAALARAVMLRMSFDSGLDFNADVDCMGMVLWICARRATEENGGLAMVHAADHPMTDYPQDWRDQLDVVGRKRKRSPIQGVNDKEEADRIEGENRDRPHVALDGRHREFIDSYNKTSFNGYWQQDHNCFVAHTCGIAQVFEQMKMKGVYKTTSEGRDPAKPNCWMYPLPGSAWRVFRFGTPEEAATWEDSTGGWKTCAINLTPSFGQVERAYDGVRLPSVNEDGVVFADPSQAQAAVAAYGSALDFPPWFNALPQPRPVTMKLRKGRGLLIAFAYIDGHDNKDGYDLQAIKTGWTKAHGPVWARIVDVETDAQQTPYESLADNAVRQVSFEGEQYGLFVKTNDGTWDKQNADRVKDNLTYRHITGGLQKDVLGWISNNPYRLVGKPFAGEYPGNREWNLRGSKLLYAPSDADGPTTHWDMILNHIGRGLDDAVESDLWCQEYHIQTGADYLRLWIANLIRFPSRRLPMLAMYSPEQNTGKSTLHEATALLFDGSGFEYGDTALTNKGGFSGELHSRALCAVEETNLANSKEAYTRIKMWVTSPRVQITFKTETPFTCDNYTHWVLSTNNIRSIPIEPGDTRIVLWEVTPFEGKEIPKLRLLAELQKEARFFMRQLYQMDLSGVCGRHTLPTLMTREKAEAMKTVAEENVFPDLQGAALKAADAILKMNKPWGPGSATDFCKSLGDWDGESKRKTLRSRANTLSRFLKKLQPHMKEKGVILEIVAGSKTPYSVSEVVSAEAPAASDVFPSIAMALALESSAAIGTD